MFKTAENYCTTSFEDLSKVTQTWKIKNFMAKCPLEHAEYLESPKFGVFGCNATFSLLLYPQGGIGASASDVSVYLKIHGVGRPILISCEISLIDRSGVKKNTVTFAKKFFGGGKVMGFPTFISRQELLDQKDELLPDDELTVSCVVTTIKKTEVSGDGLLAEDQDSVEDLAEDALVVDWTKSIDQPTDVVLRVGSEQVSAHKSVLSQSPVFQSMLEQCVVQKGDIDEIEIADVDFGVLQHLLSFVYNGKLCLHDVEIAMKLFRAADQYCLPTLVRRCSGFLCRNVCEANVLEILPVAHAFKSDRLIEQCISIIEHEMSSVTSLTDWIEQLDASPELIGLLKMYLTTNSN